MTWRSVRVRLTGLVVVVAAASVVLAATIGVTRIENSLVDDVLSEATANSLFFENAVFEELATGSGITGADREIFLEELAFIVPELEALARELDRSGAVDVVLDRLGRSRADGLPVLHTFGVVVIVGLDGAPSTALALDPGEFDGPMALESNLQELAFAAFDTEFDELIEELEERAIGGTGVFDDAFDAVIEEHLDDAADDVVVAATTAELDDLEFVIVADVGDVRRSVDKLRSILIVVGPVLVVGAAIATWLLTGRALSPVRRMSRQVASISSGTLHERVPVPATGDEIEELGVTMNAMLDRLEADDIRLRQFVSDASHELRSPVAVLRSESEVALRAPEGIDTAEFAGGVLAESLRLERIVADLLVLARGDEARGALPLAAIDLDDIVLAEAARRRRVPVDTRSVSAGQVYGSREGCTRVVVHLLDNAARHAASSVRVSLRTEGDRVVLIVDDDGGGIPVEDRLRVFERFTRLEAARSRDSGGAGLGLAVVAATVGSMGGDVRVEDSPSGGARFVVELPAAARGG